MTPSEFASATRTMALIASFMAVLLFGIAIGLYSGDFWGDAERSAENTTNIGQRQEEGLSRPVLHLDPSPAQSAEKSGAIAPCPGPQSHDQAVADCPANPSSTLAREKLLMVLALWRTQS